MKDRYRSLFCDQNFYKENQSTFKLWKTLFAPLSPVEKVQAWVVGLSCLRRPQDWYGGKRHDIFLTSDQLQPHQHMLTLQELFENTALKTNDKVHSQINLLDFINQFKIKAVPESCFRSLCFLSTKRYPLIVTTSVPTPQELLKIQISGQRIISINENYETWPTTLFSERDFLGFILHDLIHADHFFYEPTHRDGQLGFYLFIQNFLMDANLQNLLEKENFKAGFEYIISDMNSHPVHLFQTLHSLLFTSYKNDAHAQCCWQNWAKQSPFSNAQQDALLQINSIGFNKEHAKALESFCISLGQQAIS
jgi:hypothetical protein